MISMLQKNGTLTPEAAVYEDSITRGQLKGIYKTKEDGSLNTPSFEEFMSALESTVQNKNNMDTKKQELPEFEKMNLKYSIQNNFGFRSENYFVEKLKTLSDAYNKGIIKDGILNI